MAALRSLYLWITLIYALSMGLFYGLGGRFGVSYAWQHFHDVDLLQGRLWESLLYTHAFTPFMNLLAGVALKVFGASAPAAYLALFLLLGAVFANALAYVLAALGLPRGVVLGAVGLFVFSPPFWYLGSFLHYEFIAASLLTLSAALFHRALTQGGGRRWFGFFLCCALICYVRTSFHLIWLAAMVALAAVLVRRARRTVLLAAALPVALVLALYVKNQALFGFFGTSSWIGFNLAFVTTLRLSPKERRAWIRRGELHPVSGVPVYAAPSAYAPYVEIEAHTGIPVLDRQLRAHGAPNYNHVSYMSISELRKRDSLRYLAARPWDYLDTVRQGLIDYFRPTTRWHPRDRKGGSPHEANRRHVGGWERLYNRALHGFPFAPFGLYLPLLAALLYRVGLAARRLISRRPRGDPQDGLVVLMATSALYVPALSCLVTISELERYRFMVEGFMWAVALSGVHHLFVRARDARWVRRSSSAAQGAPLG